LAVKLDTHRLISLIPIMPYHKVADIGVGTSGLTPTLAKYLFDGKVFAVDTNDERLKPSRDYVEKIKLRNVQHLVYKPGDKLSLDDASLDGAVMVLSLGKSSDPDALLEETKRVLKKGGWLVILGQRRASNVNGAEAEQFVSEDDAISKARSAGYRVREQKAFSDTYYMLMLRK